MGRNTVRERNKVGDAGDLLGLLGYDLSDDAVAPGRAQGQLAVDIGQSDGQPIDFLLDDSLWAADAGVPGPHVVQAEQVVQRQQLEAMLGLLAMEMADADMLGRGSGRHPVRMLRLGGFELLGQDVVFRVRDFRPVIIVQLIVTLNFPNQCLIFILCHNKISFCLQFNILPCIRYTQNPPPTKRHLR